MAGTKTPAYEKLIVTSKDGTAIGIRKLGRGPGVVLQHGGALGSQHYMELAGALADRFTVYLPDRRGRGMSGPYGPNYCIGREDEDLAAVIAATGAPHVFSAADGGLFALHGSMSVPAVRKVALFEPVLFVGQPDLDKFKATISRGQRLVESGDIAGAMASLASDAADSDPRATEVSAPLRLLGRIMTRPAICRALLWADAKRVKGDDAPLRDLIVAWKEELNVVKSTEGTLDDFRNVTADILLLVGTNAPTLFTGTLDALQTVLPRATRVDLPGLNHGGAQDQGGEPDVIAAQLRRFFSE
jgi:pimeloyl-ACP methyl ester carboxylesterase